MLSHQTSGLLEPSINWVRDKSLILGLVDLYAFTKVLADDYAAVIQGISIEYGSQIKGTKEISLSMGWEKPCKRRIQEVNNGRPPDTTNTLLKKVKLGRPKNSVNVDQNPHSTYPCYKDSNDPRLQNRCWMAATLESLYAIFSPMWLQGTHQ